MPYRIEQQPAFTLAGIGLAASPTADFSAAWTELDRRLATLNAPFEHQETLGLCVEFRDAAHFRYLAGYTVNETAQAQAIGLECVCVPAGRYLVVNVVGAVPQAVEKGWETLFEQILPDYAQTAEAQGLPPLPAMEQAVCFERYLDGNFADSDYQMELWVRLT